MDPDDARRVVDLGADALVVSNHGGRQLDGGVLDDLRAAARGRGRAAIAARCCSMAACARARTCSRRWHWARAASLTGRAFLYGLGALGGAGVTLALQIMSRELQVSLALTGCNDVRDVDRSMLVD